VVRSINHQPSTTTKNASIRLPLHGVQALAGIAARHRRTGGRGRKLVTFVGGCETSRELEREVHALSSVVCVSVKKMTAWADEALNGVEWIAPATTQTWIVIEVDYRGYN
jgi:hypothetical protein